MGSNVLVRHSRFYPSVRQLASERAPWVCPGSLADQGGNGGIPPAPLTCGAQCVLKFRTHPPLDKTQIVSYNYVKLRSTRKGVIGLAEQLPLFPQKGMRGEKGPVVAETRPLTRTSSLATAIGAFHDHMLRQGFSENTVKAFLGDLRLLGKHSGLNGPISEFGTRELNDFLTWMLHYRGVPCSPKTYGRRVTTLKVFFGWLKESDVLSRDPAAPIPHNRVVTPMPQILHDDQVERLLATTRELMTGERPDPRPHLLVNLLLQTGIKKGECVRIGLNDVDRSNPEAPVLYVRYPNPRMHHKERKLALSPGLMPTLDRYLAACEPRENLFECTARNLEYVLRDAAQLTGLKDGVSFEMLRWTCAVRDFRSGMDPTRLRKKLGLSKITWHETVEKLKKLAEPAL
jgi:site-specific recombinase XerD